MKYKVVAIVPMRHSSERVKGKNYRDFAGKPLYHRIVDSLLACNKIDKVVIDTDSPIIIEQVSNLYPEVIVLERPEHLRDGAIPMNNVLLNTCNSIESEFYLQTHSTNPILSSETISKGIEDFIKSYPIYDSMFTVTRVQQRLWDPLARAINHNPAILLRTQDLPPTYMENSCMYLFTKETLIKKFNRIGDRPFLYEIPEIEAQDIDVELNFKVAEFLFKELYPGK
ncbi:acylneuraminate cytidylyltransferase [Emticicia oligotrophica DSM 17448]|uniref:Acylneuraminate cytidylyltransferase n=1 Tax=Emticicia oligotrophica (strain DSM 17448 / CIP 109782 / MTCC 6937 / GPTSA100-15) TaxID=929562 RepID=A0ABM5N7E2_EMTOG|nr:acylneuraminate cytidylyltransferase family protein [Emticicia oligotrophica]AFK05423.1 acylneuraminate cytidylyltransferase [Emticicia oligotrophica DSM 17448]